MNMNTASIALVAALAGATAFALFQNSTTPKVAPAAPATVQHAQTGAGLPEVNDDQQLPPNHPAMPSGAAGGGAAAMGGGQVAPSQDSAAITWKAPATWPTAPNPSSMRIATHKIPHVGSDTEDAELSISRAGGDVDANIQRWVGQFTGAQGEKRQQKTIKGLKVELVEVDGTFEGGMGTSAGTHPGWALLGAIVITPDQPYFFKMTGPAATVHAARAGFDALLASVDPTKH